MTTQPKIADLTPTQEAKLEEYYEQCLAKGLSTEPADVKQAGAAIRELYAIAEEPEPICIWVDSPLAGFKLQAEWGKEPVIEPLHVRGNSAAELAAKIAASPAAGNDETKTLASTIKDNSGTNNIVYPWYVQWGWFYSSWWRFAAFPHLHIEAFEHDKEDARTLAAWNALSDSCHMVWTFDNLAVLCDRPTVLNLNDAGDLHCIDGPAIEYADGYSVYALRGTVFTDGQEDAYFRNKEPLTITAALKERNAEVRRLVIADLIGWEKLLDLEGAEVLDEVLGDARLIKVTLPDDDEPIHLLDMLNHTCESCNKSLASCACDTPTRKRAVEGVPTTVTSVLEAHAFRWDEPVVTAEMIGARA